MTLCPRLKMHSVLGTVLYYVHLDVQASPQRPCDVIRSLCQDCIEMPQECDISRLSEAHPEDWCIARRQAGRIWREAFLSFIAAKKVGAKVSMTTVPALHLF
jgi:hypothetical protein